MKQVLINVIKFLFFLGLGVLILYLVYQNQDAAYREDCALKGVPAAECSLLQKVINDFGHVNYWWILAVLGVYSISNLSRATRWNMLLRALGYKPKLINAFITIIIGYFANLGLPRMGEVVRAGVMARYERMAIEKVMGTIVVDRVMDVISILFITALAFLLQFETIWAFVDEQVSLTERFGGVGNLLIVLSVSFAAFAALIYIFRKKLMRTPLFRKIAAIAGGFWEGIQTVRQLDRPWWFVIHSINVWLMFFFMTYLLFWAFPPTAGLPVIAVLVVFVFGTWGVVIPSPGGMGTYHFLAQLALSIYGVSGDDGFSWANISFFSVQIGSNIVGGLLGFIILPIINRHTHSSASVSTT